jgi:hypothetical protein
MIRHPDALNNTLISDPMRLRINVHSPAGMTAVSLKNAVFPQLLLQNLTGISYQISLLEE